MARLGGEAGQYANEQTDPALAYVPHKRGICKLLFGGGAGWNYGSAVSKDHSFAALIPCRNEAAALPALIAEVRLYLPSILVVDDGSEDATAAIAREMGVQCIRWAKGRGKAAALKAGFQYLADSGFSHALTLDGDGQHSPRDIPRFLQRGESAGADLVVGRRCLSAGSMPWTRRMANRAMSGCLSFCAGRSLPDSQCGFRLVKLERARQAEAATEHFEFESELLVNFALRGFRVEFVPIETIYRGEQSKICPIADTWRWLSWYAALMWRQRIIASGSSAPARKTSRDILRTRSLFLPGNSVSAGK